VDCDCRKPKPGLLLEAAKDLGLSLPSSVLIGDKRSDIEAARAAGVGRAYSLDSDNAEAITKADGSDRHFSDLFDCAIYISNTR
jgi:D-glycero-D-manno-heptose 1,7-bisphosphate phosphatase